MKNIIAFLLPFSLLISSAMGDRYATLSAGHPVELAEGETALVIFASSGHSSGSAALIYTPSDGTAAFVLLSNTNAATSSSRAKVSSSNPLPLAGPATISIDDPDLSTYVWQAIGLRITTTTVASPSATATTGAPSTAVVIPTDAAGPVEIILESSTDLVTWVAAAPGSYGATTSNRFFRLRAVNSAP